MKNFVLNTKSESGDNYTYLITHPEKPTNEELQNFLREHACDQDEDTIYEHIEGLVELDGEYLTIPSEKPNEKEFL
jgi:hypothetical protein